MVGYIGEQYLLSGTSLGAIAEEPNSIALANGKILSVSITGNGAAATVYQFSPGSKETVQLGQIGAEPYGGFGWVRMSNPSLVPTPDGGFIVVVERPVGFNLSGNGDDRLVMQKFDSSGAKVGDLRTLVSGWVDDPLVTPTDGGFFVGYRDRYAATRKFEYTGTFYKFDGSVAKTMDFGTAVPTGVSLKGGNVVTAWRDTLGIHLKVFAPDGTKITNDRVIPGSDATTYDNRTVKLAALPTGGFAALFRLGTTGDDLYFQTFTATGAKAGKLVKIALPNLSPGSSYEPDWYDIGVMKDGNVVVAWHEPDSTNPNNRDLDIKLGVYTQSGNLIFGPEVAHSPRTDSQEELQLVTMKNGNLLLTFHDGNVKQFQYVELTQGTVIQAPDHFWEGNGKANTKSGTTGDDVMLGLGGNDRISGGKGEDYIRGGNGSDTLSGGDRTDILHGEGGDDLLQGDKGGDTLTGGLGKDTLVGGAGDDDLRGDEGNDRVQGGGGNDLAYGGDGDDRLLGQTGNDKMYGEAGADTLDGGGGNDTLDGGDGNDRLSGRAGSDNLSGGAGRDKLYGGGSWDVLRGGDDNDLLKAGAGDDDLYGDKGNDRLFGQDGNDRFYGEAGNDAMFGGPGADTFQFYGLGFGNDRIKDFEPGADVLDMGWLAHALDTAGDGPIRVTDVAAGVKFAVDAANWVIIEGHTMAELTEGVDYIITSPL